MDLIRSMIDASSFGRAPTATGLAAVLFGDLAAILAACGRGGQTKTPRGSAWRGVNCRWLRG